MISPIKNIIINIDFSAGSLNALRTAIKMAGRHSACLHLLYTLDTNEIFPVEGMLPPVAALNEELMENDMSVLRKLATAVTAENGIDCKCHNKIGFPIASLCEAADELDCDLIVVPTHDQHDGSLYLFDSNAFRVLKNAKCSVLTVPIEKQFDSFQKIAFSLAPMKDVAGKYDFSRAIFKSNRANVALFGLLNRPGQQATGDLEEMIAQSKSKLQADHIPHSPGVIVGHDTAEAASETCKNLEADLVIINASRKRDLYEFFFGNYTQHMIRRQEFAVLCYQPKKQKVREMKHNTEPLRLAFG